MGWLPECHNWADPGWVVNTGSVGVREGSKSDELLENLKKSVLVFSEDCALRQMSWRPCVKLRWEVLKVVRRYQKSEPTCTHA